MLIVQGANDPRVVKEESDQVVDKLRAWGRNIEYLVMESFSKKKKKENKIKVYSTIFSFFEKHRLSQTAKA
ncbi:alpha/beta hydrolase family protein [Bacillus swezeyi]|uniref:alpha/beta hydrolase family protein n=1 Tax=Bacillus swezeyi TaxID=1925020 RepID=UPI001FD09004|nr:prolyl oligopeptidase family serine peptidase [Bacillus swezeyi]